MIKILNTKPLFQTKFLNLVVTQFQDKFGALKDWVWATRPNKVSAVMIVPIMTTPEGPKLVTIKEFRVPLADFEWSFPAGLINPGEDIVEAARRELKEETGLDILKIIKISPMAFNSAGLSDESISMVFCQVSGTLSTSGLEATEDIEVSVLSFDEIRRLMDDPAKKFGAKAWIIFYMLCEIDKLQATLKENLKSII